MGPVGRIEDYWLEQQLRLCERRGLMSGYSLSVVQEIGLSMLLTNDLLDRADDEIDALKRALVASGTRSVEDLYPEYFTTPEKAADAVVSDPEQGIDFSDLQWESPAEDDLDFLQTFLDDNQSVSIPTNEGWL